MLHFQQEGGRGEILPDDDLIHGNVPRSTERATRSEGARPP
jgi:hypothetical protein